MRKHNNTIYELAKNGQLNFIKQLLSQNPSLVIQPHPLFRTHPIAFAAQRGHVGVVIYLLEHYPEVDCTGINNLVYWSMRCRIKKKEKSY